MVELKAGGPLGKVHLVAPIIEHVALLYHGVRKRNY